ncbi:MAG: hypothetical protein AABW46_04425 [Nanoarchaeota archaeon]
MADETVLEIWSRKRTWLLNGGGNYPQLRGEVSLGGLKKKLDANIVLPRNERIACLETLRIDEEQADPGKTSEWEAMYSMGLREALFSWHLGLNKARNKANAIIDDMFPSRHVLGLNSGILPLGIMGITLTRDGGNFLLGVRDPNATATVGNYCLVPAGFFGFRKPGADDKKVVSNTFYREFFEEVLYGPDFFDLNPAEALQSYIDPLVRSYSQGQISLPHIVGLTYEDRNNRGFGVPITFKTSFTAKGLNEYLKAKNPDVEHIGYELREFSPESIEHLVRSRGRGVEIHTLGALLCAGENEFENGEEWYQKMVTKVVPQHYGKVMTLPETTFDETRDVVELIKGTMPRRYPS